MSQKKEIKVTLNGITYKADPDLFDDNYELVELLEEIEENPVKFPRFIKILTGDKYEETKEALRDPETGKITNEAMRKFADEFAVAVSALKN